jgi:Holliday junction resolvase
VLRKYYDNLLDGNQVKDLVKVLLENAGYKVYPYGYESTFSDIKNKLREKGSGDSKTAHRIRCSPDLLVYDGKTKDVMLVEVKMRRQRNEKYVSIYKGAKLKRIANYIEFWNDSILILVIPLGNVFYAQKMSELTPKDWYDITTDFEKIEDVFTRIEAKDMRYFQARAYRIMEE